MKDSRPRFLDLLAIRLPLPGVASFLHRISGVLLVLGIPLALYGLDLSLASAEGFARVSQWVNGGAGRLVVVLMSWALGYHFFAGIRYLLLDVEIGMDRPRARMSAALVIAAGLVCAVLAFLAGGRGV